MCSWTEKFQRIVKEAGAFRDTTKGSFRILLTSIMIHPFQKASHYLVRNKIISLPEYSELSGSLSVYLYKWLKNCDPRKTRVNMEQRLESFLHLSSYYEIFNFRKNFIVVDFINLSQTCPESPGDPSNSRNFGSKWELKARGARMIWTWIELLHFACEGSIYNVQPCTSRVKNGSLTK